jgi:signal transduction histidine kinase
VELELAPVLMACVEMLRPAAAAAGLELCVQAAAGLRATTDERCLRQILLNLGSNAIKYGRVEGVRSAVVLAARAAAGRVQVTVTDSGPGMTGAQLERLFQPFERLSQATGPQPGTGLGLVITRQLAHSVAGEVTIESQPGHGTVATLSLPA